MYRTLKALKQDLNGALEIQGNTVRVLDLEKVRTLVDSWVYTSVFSPEPELRQAARFLIRATAQALNLHLASIHEFYMGRGRGEYGGFTVPAMNLRGLTYHSARRVFRVAKEMDAGAFIFEIARTEISYTNQPPDEYATSILAAAIKEGYEGPVFVQGDHFQVRLKAYKENPEAEIQALKDLIRDALAAGFYNIDIDASTMVDLDKEDLKEQQEPNAELTALFTRYIRETEPEGIVTSLGGEIGEIGGRNSTPEDLRAFMDQYLPKIGDLPGISKISVQTGTVHGGVVLPDGSLAQVKVDFDVLETLSRIAREEYGLAGAVQHGASTLPEEAFSLFPKVETAEVHLATQFQNIIYDSPELPEDFKRTVYDYLFEKYGDQRKPGETDEQFIYKNRKRGFGPFKWEWWTLSEDILNPIMDRLEQKFRTIFRELKVAETKNLVLQKTPIVPMKLEVPESLKAGGEQDG